MANTKSAEKAARQAQLHRDRNVAMRSRMRTAIRKVIDAAAAGNKDQAKASYRAALAADADNHDAAMLLTAADGLASVPTSN